MQSFAKRLLAHFGEGRRPRQFLVERFILGDAGFQRAWRKDSLILSDFKCRSPLMCPASGPPREWKVPSLRTTGELARWLNLQPNELAWFADCRTQEQKLPDGPLRHYRYQWKTKRDGSARLIESPKQHLKILQRFLLAKILDHIPPHSVAHGFRAGRSIKTFAEPHSNRHIVLKLDLKDFFPGTFRARILAIFMTAGYPEAVARLLTGLCTNSVPPGVISTCPAAVSATQRRRMKLLYQRPHLPQGAPTSPALANLAAYRFDCRLAGLAKAADAHYTRYADDLVFSGDKGFAAMIDRFYIQVCAIALEEGFEVHTRKTRIMRRSVAQRAVGLVLNSHLNVSRDSFDRLKAILHNCVVHGPDGQNRDGVADFQAHLAGRIAHVEMINPTRGKRLREKFQRIAWAGRRAD